MKVLDFVQFGGGVWSGTSVSISPYRTGSCYRLAAPCPIEANTRLDEDGLRGRYNGTGMERYHGVGNFR